MGANVNAFDWTFYNQNNTYSTRTKGDGSLVKTTGDEYWSGTIILDGKYVVDNGHTITIAPGTIIKGVSKNTPAEASAFIVAKGGKVEAVGTADQPIIFTAQADPMDGTDLGTGGLWGGVVILGQAQVGTDTGEASIEGIPVNQGLVYGGNDDSDNSGTLKYVSIRYGGVALSPGKEINGLTLGGVGSGTTIDNIEVIYNLDDGIEFFGGTVDASNLLVWNHGDDGIDVDQAYSGTISNVVVAVGTTSDTVFEIDGTEDTVSPILDRSHTVTNVTAIGLNGSSATFGDWKSSPKGIYSNMFFNGFDAGTTEKGVANYNNGLTFSNIEICTTDAAATAFPTISADVTVTCSPSTSVGANTSSLLWTFYAQNNNFEQNATLSVEDIVIDDAEQITVNVYPNPVKNEVSVSSNLNIDALNLYNISGQMIKQSKGNKLQVSDLRSGVYILSIQVKDAVINKRIIKL